MNLSDKINKIMPYLFPFLVVGFLFVYYFVDPSDDSFPLHCIWKDLTGTECPSCGTQRALYCIMHGEFSKALRYNFFFVISVPYATLAVLCSWYNYKNALNGVKSIIYGGRILKLYVIFYFIWWIIRNIITI